MPEETLAQKKRRARKIAEILDKEYPNATTELHYRTPFELLIATILSARATDVKVNEVTAELFKTHNKPEHFAQADPQWLEQVLHPTGFYRNKTKNIIAASKMILERFGGEVPRTMEEMIQLPGVSRKTANVVLGCAFGIASGIVVDTHVARLSMRMGLASPQLNRAEPDPEKIEKELMALLPQERWISFSHCLILHGRRVCTARKPACARCVVEKLCPKVGVA